MSIIVHISLPYKRGWEQTHLWPFFRKLVIYKWFKAVSRVFFFLNYSYLSPPLHPCLYCKQRTLVTSRIQNNQNFDAKHQIMCVSCLTRAAFDLIGFDSLSGNWDFIDSYYIYIKVEVKTTSYRYTRTIMYSVSMHVYISHNIKYFLLHIQYICFHSHCKWSADSISS